MTGNMSAQTAHLRLVETRPEAEPPRTPRALLVPASPPDRVRDAVGHAAARVDELAAADRELHFDVDPGTGRLVIQVRDLSGAVLDELAPSAALEVIAGAELP
jgi:hypothetical protein